MKINRIIIVNIMRAAILRFTNISLLGLLIILCASGLYGLTWTSGGWVMEVHRIAGWALTALIPWKVGISWRSLKRGVDRRFDRNVMLGVSLLLAVLALCTLTLAALWTWRIGPEILVTPWFSQTALGWHWILGIILMVPLGLHVWRRWPKPRRSDFASRRGFLRLSVYVGAGLAGWWAAAAIAKQREVPTHPRSITGSRKDEQFSGNAFAITGEAFPEINISNWQLAVQGAVRSPFRLSYTELLALPRVSQAATLDCTNGWWTTQTWEGVALADLLEQAGLLGEALAVRLSSVTGYGQVFTLSEARQILIATHVGGQTLDTWHGYPARVVAPFRRGWFWVKWLGEITVLTNAGQILAQPFSVR